MFQIVGVLLIWLVLGLATFGVGLVVFPVIFWLVVIRGSEERAETARKKLDSTLMKDEQLIADAIQNRIAALLVRRKFVAITNSRIITIERSWLGGFRMGDYQWKDLHDVRLEENILPNIFGSRLNFMAGTNGAQLNIDNIPSAVASRIYSHAQAEEQAWEEKRRIRAIEEARASSGAVSISGFAGRGHAQESSVLDELVKAKALLDSGVVSDAEYHEIKAKILSR